MKDQVCSTSSSEDDSTQKDYKKLFEDSVKTRDIAKSRLRDIEEQVKRYKLLSELQSKKSDDVLRNHRFIITPKMIFGTDAKNDRIEELCPVFCFLRDFSRVDDHIKLNFYCTNDTIKLKDKIEGVKRISITYVDGCANEVAGENLFLSHVCTDYALSYTDTNIMILSVEYQIVNNDDSEKFKRDGIKKVSRSLVDKWAPVLRKMVIPVGREYFAADLLEKKGIEYKIGRDTKNCDISHFSGVVVPEVQDEVLNFKCQSSQGEQLLKCPDCAADLAFESGKLKFIKHNC